MTIRHRLTTSLVLAAAVIAWAAVVLLFTSVSPVGDSRIQVAGALLLGTAIGLSVWPITWRLGVALGGEPGAGGWPRAGRRAALIGLCIAILVVLRALGAFSLPIGLFVVIVAVLVEVAFALRR